MNILPYIKDLSAIPTFGKEIGSGADGQIFELPNNKVLKLSIHFSFENDILNHFIKINDNYNFIIKKDYNNIVKIFDINLLIAKMNDGDHNYIIYYSIMEKLNHLTEDDHKVLKPLCDIINFHYEDNYPNIVNELSNYYSFNKDKVLEFYDFIKSSGFIHNDFHRRNILKDDLGNFKLIDLDRISI